MNAIGKREKQGRTFWFLNRRGEPFEWTNKVPEDDAEFQGLFEEEEAVYPDVSAKLPGLELEEEEFDFMPVTKEPTVCFGDLTVAALHNAGINADDRLQAVRKAAAVAGIKQAQESAVFEADEDEIM